MTTVQQISPRGAKNPHLQFWLNPVNNIVYETIGEPEHGFTNEIGATPVYDAAAGWNNLQKIQKVSASGDITQNFVDDLPSPYKEAELERDAIQYHSLITRNRVKEATLLSTVNQAVDVVQIFPQLYGLRDRNYAGVELAQRVATETLILNFDKIRKQDGMPEIPENTVPRGQDISYERVKLETKKFGLMSRVTDEAMRRNVHNPFQDSITTASTKVAQRKAFDVITELDNNLTSTAALNDWDAFEPGSTRSLVDPTKDILRAVVSSIEGTNVGGRFNTLGLHQIGSKVYENNSFLRGTTNPTPGTDFAPGTKPAIGLEGVTMVMDQFIPQGDAFLVDVGVESCCILLEGPTRVATKTDELTATQTYVTISHHVAKIINPVTGVKLTNVYTPIPPLT